MLITPNSDASVESTSQLPFSLARYSHRDCYFDLKLTQVESTTFHGKPARQLQFKLNLVRPFDIAKRIRAATISVKVSKQKKSPASPKITGIDPEASLVKIADHEITTGQTIGVSAGTPAPAPGSVSASANLSWGDKTTFAGNRLIHGFMVSEHDAQWKMYEEPRSKSGLPPSLSLLVIVESDDEFRVSAKLSLRRWRGWGMFGMEKSISAPSDGVTPVHFLVRRASPESVGKQALETSDSITLLLKESDEKAQILERVVNQLFPQLDSYASFTKGGAVIAAQKEIVAKFKLLQSTAASPEQRQFLSILRDAVDRRLESLSTKPFENADHHDLEDRHAPTASFGAASLLNEHATLSEPARPTPSARTPLPPPPAPTVYEIGDLNRLLLKTSGETALQNHRPVGRDWKEIKL